MVLFLLLALVLVNFNVPVKAAFQETKRFPTTTPLLVLPNFPQLFELHCDAPKKGIGVVLSQSNRLVAQFNEKLSGS